MPRIPSSVIARCARAGASVADGSSMKNPTKRVGWCATASATDSSSPGTLAISAARATSRVSSSLTHRSARASGSPGTSHSSSPQRSASDCDRPRWADSVAKNLGEKKWQWASLTMRNQESGVRNQESQGAQLACAPCPGDGEDNRNEDESNRESD